MGSSDSRSWNKHRLDGISKGLEFFADSFDGKGLSQGILVKLLTLSEKSPLASHVSAYPAFDHSGEASNILTDNPSGPDFVNSPQHLRPEVTVVVSSFSLAGIGKRLAREASGEDVNPSAPFREVCFGDVFITLAFRKPVFQNAPPEGIYLAMESVLPAKHCSCHLRATNPGKKARVRHNYISTA